MAALFSALVASAFRSFLNHRIARICSNSSANNISTYSEYACQLAWRNNNEWMHEIFTGDDVPGVVNRKLTWLGAQVCVDCDRMESLEGADLNLNIGFVDDHAWYNSWNSIFLPWNINSNAAMNCISLRSYFCNGNMGCFDIRNVANNLASMPLPVIES